MSDFYSNTYLIPAIVLAYVCFAFLIDYPYDLIMISELILFSNIMCLVLIICHILLGLSFWRNLLLCVVYALLFDEKYYIIRNHVKLMTCK